MNPGSKGIFLYCLTKSPVTTMRPGNNKILIVLEFLMVPKYHTHKVSQITA